MSKPGMADPLGRQRGKYSLAMELLAHKVEEVSYLKGVLANIAALDDVPDCAREMANAGISTSSIVALGLSNQVVELSAHAPNQCQACAAP